MDPYNLAHRVHIAFSRSNRLERPEEEMALYVERPLLELINRIRTGFSTELPSPANMLIRIALQQLSRREGRSEELYVLLSRNPRSSGDFDPLLYRVSLNPQSQGVFDDEDDDSYEYDDDDNFEDDEESDAGSLHSLLGHAFTNARTVKSEEE